MFFIAYSDSDVLGALTWAALHSLDTVYCACIALLFPIAISFSRKLSRSAGLVTCGAPAASVPTSTALASSFFTHYPAYIPSTATCNNTPTPEPVNILSQQHGGQRRLAARVLPAAATDSGAGATGRGVRRKEQMRIAPRTLQRRSPSHSSDYQRSCATKFTVTYSPIIVKNAVSTYTT
ncbi:hypothetical protein BU26DRAFT_92497 [Trematosphaeria pertusa]|uniref:Uncharacterized protein n=1 Tax=Trematosphaeria pertusa TaxID=390896 RepID=A0A6A6I1N4_9PLEO|nr:uncharacterized protein BU26DRAFT_92497 [Trematosphaeria pertusa]KAF2244049.1 hypothetical protein BU26DRAFT_92497 [Trematosphaeria pertusa]